MTDRMTDRVTDADVQAMCDHGPVRDWWRCRRCRTQRVAVRIHDNPPVYVETVGQWQYLALKRLLSRAVPRGVPPDA